MYLLYLFLSRFAIARVVHSFPTRRSSDLACRHELVGRRSEPQQRNDTRARELDGTAGRLCRGCAPADAGPCIHPPADRKSTRLNSSHVKISYAVFCLKKKTFNTSQILATG